MDNNEQAPTPQVAKKPAPKFLLPALLVAILLLAGAAGYMLLAKKDSQAPSNTTVTQNAPSPISGSVISSIQEALASSASLKCDYTDETGQTITSYMKSGMIRTDIAASGAQLATSMIMKEKKMYYWSGKQGTMMEFDLNSMMEKITSTPQTSPSVKTEQNPQDFVDRLEKYKQSCKQASVDDALFTPPADVKFTDLSAMMQKSQAVPSGMSAEQIKALQQQYQQ